MSEYVYPCPSGYYGGSPKCDGICVFSMVVDEKGIFSHWNQCCCGCGRGTFCDEPLEGRDFFSLKDATALASEGATFSTPCLSSVQAGSDKLLTGGGAVSNTFGFIRVQSVDDPRVSFGPTRVNLSADTKKIQMGGWVITFTRLQSPEDNLPQNTNAQILPPQLPMASFDIFDQFRTALVVLPEAFGLHQYIVTVPESVNHPEPPSKYSILLTREWQVSFARAPISPSPAPQARKSGNCGCS